jgi:hypothetical protein
MNGQLVVRIGGGYIQIEEFIRSYGEKEEIKVKQRLDRGEDVFGEGSPARSSSMSPKGNKDRYRYS